MKDPTVPHTADEWDAAYLARGVDAVSWYEASPRVSLELISALGVPLDAAVIDIGGGASALVDELVAQGYTDLTVLDLSGAALRGAQARPGAGGVTWLREDVLAWRPGRRYALWHDRAVLHFFVEEPARQAYLRALDAAVAPGGYVVIGVFAPDGPERCSGLPVQRYSAASLAELLGREYVPKLERRDVHVTPRGVRQPFTWAGFQREAA